MSLPPTPIATTCLYDSKDESFFQELKKQLSGLIRSNRIKLWDPSQIILGSEREKEID